jgi:hypothetical protein
VFAALLDGLVNKSGKGSAGFLGQIKEVHTAEEGVSAGKTGKTEKSLSRLKKSSLPDAETGEPAQNSGELPVFLAQNSPDSPNIQVSQTVAETGNPVRLAAPEAGEAVPVSRDAVVSGKDRDLLSPPAQKDRDPGEVFPAPAGKEEPGLSELVREAAASGPVKEGRGAVDLLLSSARNLESGARWVTGESRPGLVDMPVAENQGESGREAKSPAARRARDRISVELRDLRTEKAPSVPGGGVLEKTAPAALRIDADIPVELRVPGPRGQEAGEGFMNKSAFEDALAQQLHENLSSDIVKQASIIVRDSGEGTIRLSLKPETLGNVKIRLEMTENKITGHIVVESSEAFKAFERELPVLEKQFQDSGFSETNLEMSFAWDNESGAQYRQDEGEPRFPAVLAASRYDAETERTEGTPQAGGFRDTGRSAVNMLI